MTPYLPRTVAIGDKLRLVPYALNKQDNGNERCQQPHALTGQVIYIHPARRFATVRFPLTGYDSTGHMVNKSFRECWPIMPDERRIAVKPMEETQTGRPAGHNREPARIHKTYPGQWKIRDFREARGLSIRTVADRAGVSDSTISKWELGKYHANWELLEAALPGVTAYASRKAAAGSASSDSGKSK